MMLTWGEITAVYAGGVEAVIGVMERLQAISAAQPAGLQGHQRA